MINLLLRWAINAGALFAPQYVEALHAVRRKGLINALLDPTALPASGLAEEVLENIVEDVAEAALSAEIESLRSLRSTGMAEGIVSPPFFLVADDLVGFVQLFKFFFGGFLLFGGRVEIGVVLPGEFAGMPLE